MILKCGIWQLCRRAAKFKQKIFWPQRISIHHGCNGLRKYWKIFESFLVKKALLKITFNYWIFYFLIFSGPNLCVQNCFVDSHDIRYPWVSFFTTKYVAAGGELNWNYYGLAVSSDDETNDSAVPDNPSSRCNCGSSSCKKKAFFRH